MKADAAAETAQDQDDQSAAPEPALEPAPQWSSYRTGPPDAEALLVALTLSPATYSRNRFFEMYRSPDMQRTRRRAGQLRGIVTALASDAAAKVAGRVLSIDVTEDGGAVLAYVVPSVGMRRTVRLRAIELSLLRYCVGRARGEGAHEGLQPGMDDSARIGFALQRLSPVSALPA
jgi:hypothetical protein